MKKFIKYGMSLALLLGCVTLTGCEDDNDYEVIETSNWINGAGAPTKANKGKIGKYYFDTVNHDIYSYTVDGWKLVSDLEVKNSEPHKWFSGVGIPSSSVPGKVGDFYFDTLNYDVYNYTNDGWSLVNDLEVKQEEKVSLDGEYKSTFSSKNNIIIYNNAFFIRDTDIRGTYTIDSSDKVYGEYVLNMVSEDNTKKFIVDISVPHKIYNNIKVEDYSGEYITADLSKLLGLTEEELTFVYDKESGVITVPEIEGVGEAVEEHKLAAGNNCFVFNLRYKDPGTNQMVTKENLWLLLDYINEGTTSFGYKKDYPFLGETILAYYQNDPTRLMYGGYFDEEEKFQVSLEPSGGNIGSATLYKTLYSEFGEVSVTLQVSQAEVIIFEYPDEPYREIVDISDLPTIVNNQMVVTTSTRTITIEVDNDGKIVDVTVELINE